MYVFGLHWGSRLNGSLFWLKLRFAIEQDCFESLVDKYAKLVNNSKKKVVQDCLLNKYFFTERLYKNGLCNIEQ